MLSQTVMQVLTNAALFVSADLQNSFLQMLALGNVADRAGNQDALFRFQGTQADFHGEFVAVSVQTKEFLAGSSHGADARLVKKTLAMLRVTMPQPWRNQ